ncbi:MAG: cell surface protein SprA, partial [Salegentibacter sp.]
YADNSVGLWNDFFSIGQPDMHYQTFQLNYEVPFQKIPVLSFIKATYSYTGDFQWQRGSRIYQQLEGVPFIGNSVQNSNTHQINANLDMPALYKYMGLVKKKSGAQSIKQRSAGVPTLNPGQKEEPKKEENKIEKTSKGYNTLVDIVTAVKRLQVNYRKSQGIFLPGYTQSVGFMGTLQPTAGFTFGLQDEVRYLAARNGWLTLFQNFNQQYTEVYTRQLEIQGTLDLLPDLTVELNGRRSYSENFSENYRVDPVTLEYNALTPYSYGNFNISTILLKTAFNHRSQASSETFMAFRENRLEIARRLAAEKGLDPNDTDDSGFPVGIGKTNQAVLLPAFLAAYSGKDPGNVKLSAFRDAPLPNWDIKYTGLMRLEWFRKKFRRFSLAHGYQANYTINQFQTNLEYDPQDETATNQAGDFQNPILFSNVVLTELFTPLIRIDLETKNAVQVLAEIKKDRALALSFDNNLLTETTGNEYTLGLGYRIKDLKIATSIAGHNRILSSDLNFKADVSYRKNNTIIRYLDLDNSQVVAGQSLWAINFTADYALSKNLTAIFYYDHSFSKYAVSTAFPQTTIRSGITLRYNFGN